ncbi:MAG: hypothetical protein HUJ58_08555 [Erysipelotrichaceae bacterium]|nr:hypothetical protein [Erysipelotrichaceae bacterium]
MKFAAMMFDIIDSRTYRNSYELHDFVNKCITYLNRMYASELKKDIVAGAGDEFQGLFLNLPSAFAYIRKLQFLLYPVRIRCGIGYGTIKYDVKEWSSVSHDGEAYYLARDAIRVISKSKNNSICFCTHSRYDTIINAMCSASMRMKSEQRAMANTIELLSDLIFPLSDTPEEKEFYSFLTTYNTEAFVKGSNPNAFSGCKIPFQADRIPFSLHPSEKERSIAIRSPVDEFWAHGMSTVLSQILDTTRQNIDKHIHTGMIKESRATDKAIYKMLGEPLW